MLRFTSFLGFFVFLGIAWLLSVRRPKIVWRTVWMGSLLQLGFALLILRTPIGRPLFDAIGSLFERLLQFTDEGSRFVFGNLVDKETFGFMLAFHVLPIIIFVGSLSAVLYYLKILPVIVTAMAKMMKKSLGVSGAEGVAVASNVFVGMTEAFLTIRPFNKKLTESELFCVMTTGMATIAGSVMAAYVGLLSAKVPNIAGHLLTASIMSAPAAIVIAKIMIPETKTPSTLKTKDIQAISQTDTNVIDAAARGARDGLGLALNVAAILLAFISLIALLNFCLGLVGSEFNSMFGWNIDLSLQSVLGVAFSPIALLMGIEPKDAMAVGRLLGEKVVLNEFVAYLSLTSSLETLSPRSVIIASYALCGFANFGSVGIMIGGVPERARDIARLGIRSIIGGSLAAFMTASIAGILI